MARTKNPSYIPALPAGTIRIEKRTDQGGFKAKRKTDSFPRKWVNIPCTPELLDRYGPKDWRAVIERERDESRSNRLKPIKIENDMPKKCNPLTQTLYTTKNPSKVKIKSDAEKLEAGFVWVWLDKKTKVLRHPSKLAV